MKKLIIAALLLASTSIVVMAQTDAREKARQERITKSIDQMKAALATQNFTFMPYQMQLAYSNPVELNSLAITPYIDLSMQSLTLNVPFSLQMFQPNAKVFDLYLTNVPYKYTVKSDGNNTYYVTVILRNVANNNITFNPVATQDMNLTIHFTIDVKSSYTTATIVPDFGAATSYTGTVSPN